MNKTTSPAEILQTARDFIQNVGWCQGRYRDYTDNGILCALCATGAFNIAIDVLKGSISSTDAEYMAYNYLSNATDPYMGVVAWNDNSLRTKEQVLAAFDKAIEQAKKDSP